MPSARPLTLGTRLHRNGGGGDTTHDTFSLPSPHGEHPRPPAPQCRRPPPPPTSARVPPQPGPPPVLGGRPGAGSDARSGPCPGRGTDGPGGQGARRAHRGAGRRPAVPGQALLVVHGGHDAAVQVLGGARAAVAPPPARRRRPPLQQLPHRHDARVRGPEAPPAALPSPPARARRERLPPPQAAPPVVPCERLRSSPTHTPTHTPPGNGVGWQMAARPRVPVEGPPSPQLPGRASAGGRRPSCKAEGRSSSDSS